MGFESDVKEYHRRAGRRPDEDDAARPRPGQRQGHFQPRQMRVKKEEPEVDFKTRMKNLTKTAAKTHSWIKKEDPDKPVKVKKERRRKSYDSYSEDSEEEDRRLTRKAKKKLGLSDSDEELELSARERDARTVIAMQLAHEIREFDLKDFFSSVGDVRAVKLIKDERHKTQGLAYIEFKHVQSVPLAMGLTGQRVLGRAIVVHHAQADKNRHSEKLEQAKKNLMKAGTGPYKIRVDKLHKTVTEEQLKMIMEPFGRVEKVQIIKDGFTGGSSGTAFVTFVDCEGGEDAIRHLHNFDLGGLNLILRLVAKGKAAREHEHDLRQLMIENSHNPNAMKAMLGVGAAPQKKAIEGVQYTPVKSEVSTAGSGYGNSKAAQRLMARRQAAPISTQCFQIVNAFDVNEKGKWPDKVKKDVIQRVSNFGDVYHVHVDQNSLAGNVFVKVASAASCQSAVNSLHGRQFRGRSVTAAYVPLPNYHQLFPASVTAAVKLK